MTSRWLAKTVVLPLVYIAVLCVAMQPPKAKYVFANPTVMTVSDKGGPQAMHAPPAVYPAGALRAGVEGRVIMKVRISGDGTVRQAEAISGPEALRKAAVENVRQWQFEPKVQDAEIDAGFSLSDATRSVALPEPVRRVPPKYRGNLRGSVRVVAMVDPDGRVEFVQPVTGPEPLVAAAVESVRHWTFRPMLRNGKPEHGTALIDVPFGL
jgi:TonB family protein